MQKNDGVMKRDWYLDSVYKDQDFRHDVKALSEKEIISKYHLSKEEIDFFAQGSFDRGRFINRRDSIAFHTDEKNKIITMNIGKDATLSDVQEAWPIVRAMKWSMYGQEETRHRSPDHPQIVYAVYKQQASGLKRSQIFERYTSGKLLNEDYDTSLFLTPKDLVDYCRPYFSQIEGNQTRKKPEFKQQLKMLKNLFKQG